MEKKMILPLPKTLNDTANHQNQSIHRSQQFSLLPSIHNLVNHTENDRFEDTPRTLPPITKLSISPPLSVVVEKKETKIDNDIDVNIFRRRAHSDSGSPSESLSDLDFKQLQEKLLHDRPEPGYIHEWNQKQGRGARYKKKIHCKKCHICGKEFSRPSTLKTHVVVHSQAKPFGCGYPGCNKSYNVKSNLRRHEKKHKCHKC
ncbi:unnamed protein product [Kluyveromyces dobzhanskii CBS 2104]|uniref:WGS project CCBQ000000000 data, contig 00058 n=1 Tax=Kluyveromyces dobzhanskii CBS 2104 TaxID=1427455 RepID=A0A0A8LBD1_9SACH|nr:unnamed protein product [Kluyveromyces dobzhanskii CBS 2104]